MRIALLSDIHGNRTALEAVIADLAQVSPDLVLHGGDLADGGSSPVAVVDRVRELGWQGVLGNTDEMLIQPDALREIAARNPNLSRLFQVVEEMAAATRELLGEERLAWLGTLPRGLATEGLSLVHGSPDSPWAAPTSEAGDDDLLATYRPLGSPIAVYGHIHRPFVRTLRGLTVANSGSVGLSYDGDPRASYLLVSHQGVEVRRVDYDVDVEIRRLMCSSLPNTAWVAALLRGASFLMPE